MMTDIMERKTLEPGDDAMAEFARSVEGSREYMQLVHETFFDIIREAAPRGGIPYDDVLSEAQRRLQDEFTHLNHSRDFFDNILNGLSIARKIDSGVSNRLFVAGEQPWRLDKSLGRGALNR